MLTYVIINISKDKAISDMKETEEQLITTNADMFEKYFGFRLSYCEGIKCPKEVSCCNECDYRNFWSNEYRGTIG